MDFATWVGLVFTIVLLIVQSPWITATLGMVAVLTLAFSFRQITQGLQASLSVFQSTGSPTGALVEEMIRMATLARKEGILVLESQRTSLKNPQFRKAVKWISDGYDAQSLKEMLTAEMSREFSENEVSILFMEKASVLMRGVSGVTLLMAIIEASKMMADPDKLAIALASGFSAALLPLALSVFLFSPMAEKLKSKLTAEKLPYHLISIGVLGILEGMSPAFLEEKLKLRASFISET